METVVAVALLGAACVLGMSNPAHDVADLRTTIQKDLQNVIDHVTVAENAGRSIIHSASSMKLRRQELCWKLASNNVKVNALPDTNALTQVYDYIDDIGQQLPTATDEEINGLLYKVLDGDNSTITWTLSTANSMMANANKLIQVLSLDLTC